MECFLGPYMNILHGAAFSVQQTLEGLDIQTAERPFEVPGAVASTLWDLTAAISLPLLLLKVYLIALILMVIWAAHCLYGLRGAGIALLIVAAPGVGSLAGLPAGRGWVPADYRVGAGDLGSPWGMLALALLGLITGWSLTVITTKYLKLGDRFRNAYDHVWYSMAVVTGVLFVADTLAHNHRQRLEDLNRDSREASAYLLHQVRALDAECRAGSVEAPYACRWASQAQQKLTEYAHMGSASYWQLGPRSSSEIYLPVARQDGLASVEKIRRELIRLNDERCPVQRLDAGVSLQAPVSGVCAYSPAAFQTAFPEQLAGVKSAFDIFRPVSIANEAIVPLLLRMRDLQDRFMNEVKQAASDRHFRWIFYVAFSFLAGGKVGNATGRLKASGSALPLANAVATTGWRRVKVPHLSRRIHAAGEVGRPSRWPSRKRTLPRIC